MNSHKKLSTPPKAIGRFATPEKAAGVKANELSNQIRKAGIRISKSKSLSK